MVTYSRALPLVKEVCVSHDLIFNPNTVIVDFEEAIHNAVASVFPDLTLVGCRFHLSQAWYRNIQKLGLTTEYKNRDSEIGRWLKHSFGMMFLDPHEVGEFFAEKFAQTKPTDERVTKFADYLVDNWISEDAAFPPELWASKSATATRTTNACESFHSHFNQSFYSSHPSLFIFIFYIYILKSVQIETYIKIRSVDKIRQHNIQTCRIISARNSAICSLKRGDICRYEYVKLISHLYTN